MDNTPRQLNLSRDSVAALSIRCGYEDCARTVGIGMIVGRQSQGLTLRSLEAELVKGNWGMILRVAQTPKGQMEIIVPVCPECNAKIHAEKAEVPG